MLFDDENHPKFTEVFGIITMLLAFISMVVSGICSVGLLLYELYQFIVIQKMYISPYIWSVTGYITLGFLGYSTSIFIIWVIILLHKKRRSDMRRGIKCLKKIKAYFEHRSDRKFSRKYKTFIYNFDDWQVVFAVARKPYREKIIKRYDRGVISAVLETILVCQIFSKRTGISEKNEIITNQYLHMDKKKMQLVSASNHFNEDDLKLPIIQDMIEHIKLKEMRKQTVAGLDF